MQSPFDGQLGKGVIWALQQYGDLSAKDISNIIGWKIKSVQDEIRRITKETVLGLWIEKVIDNRVNVYSLHETFRKAPLDVVLTMAKDTYKFNSNIYERLQK